jgi:valyl-tRNA synthetase
LLHPFMPYITEEIWQRVAPLTAKEGDSIMLQPYPVSNPDYLDPQAQSDIEWVKGVIIGLRNIRGEMNIPPGKAIPVLLKNGSQEDQRRLQENRQFLMTLAKLEDITWLADQQEHPLSATALVDQMEILVPMANLIDKEAEIARLGKEIDKLAKEVNRLSGKLDNANFVAKAPAEVVAKEQEKLAVQQQAQVKLEEQLATIKAM